MTARSTTPSEKVITVLLTSVAIVVFSGLILAATEMRSRYSTGSTDNAQQMLLLGNPDIPQCSVLISVENFKDMNEMGVYRWVAECEAALRTDY